MGRIEMQTLTTFEFDEAFVWPDGEPQPTAAKVGEQFTECELDDVLFGDPPPKTIVDRVEL